MMVNVDTRTSYPQLDLKVLKRSNLMVLNVPSYNPIKLLSVALIKLNADAELYEQGDVPTKYLKPYEDRVSFMADEIDDMCALVYADKELVIATAKALKRRKRRHGIDTPSYKLAGQINSLCAFFSGYMVI